LVSNIENILDSVYKDEVISSENIDSIFTLAIHDQVEEKSVLTCQLFYAQKYVAIKR